MQDRFNQKIAGEIDVYWDKLKKKFVLQLGRLATFFISLSQLREIIFKCEMGEQDQARILQDREWDRKMMKLGEEFISVPQDKKFYERSKELDKESEELSRKRE